MTAQTHTPMKQHGHMIILEPYKMNRTDWMQQMYLCQINSVWVDVGVSVSIAAVTVSIYRPSPKTAT